MQDIFFIMGHVLVRGPQHVGSIVTIVPQQGSPFVLCRPWSGSSDNNQDLSPSTPSIYEGWQAFPRCSRSMLSALSRSSYRQGANFWGSGFQRPWANPFLGMRCSIHEPTLCGVEVIFGHRSRLPNLSFR